MLWIVGHYSFFWWLRNNIVWSIYFPLFSFCVYGSFVSGGDGFGGDGDLIWSWEFGEFSFGEMQRDCVALRWDMWFSCCSFRIMLNISMICAVEVVYSDLWVSNVCSILLICSFYFFFRSFYHISGLLDTFVDCGNSDFLHFWLPVNWCICGFYDVFF